MLIFDTIRNRNMKPPYEITLKNDSLFFIPDHILYYIIFNTFRRVNIMKTMVLVLCLIFIAAACDFNKSVSKDLMTGLSSKGDGLSCDEVYLTVGDEKVTTKVLTYGDILHVNFSDISGFKMENDYAFPGLKLYVTDSKNKTVFSADDLYEEFSETGVNFTPLLLTSDLTLATPFMPGNEYKLFVNIWDKKGTGKFSAEYDFKLEPNKLIKVESDQLKYDVISLFSYERKAYINDNNINLNEKITMVFENLTNLKPDNGKYYLGMSSKATDSKGNILLDEPDLLASYDAEGISPEDIKRLWSDIVFTGESIAFPVKYEVTVWDKRGNGKLKATADLSME